MFTVNHVNLNEKNLLMAKELYSKTTSSSRRLQVVGRGAIELMITICKEPWTDLGQKVGKSSDVNDDALSGSFENILSIIKQRRSHR